MTFSKTEENYIDHEVRIRKVEESYSDLKLSIINLNEKIDSHFKWTLGTMIGFFGVIYPLLGGIVLHLAKLI
jgi:hypothetical protein